MTGITATTELSAIECFNSFFTRNYNKLYGEAISIFKHHDYSQDFMHDVYYKMYRRIHENGEFNGSFHGYFWRSLHNEMLMAYNKNKLRTYIDYDDPKNHPVIEERLQDKHSEEINSQQFYNALQFLCNQLFIFIDKRHSPIKANIFKHYFLGDAKRLTYAKLSKRTGYSTFYISIAIKEIKDDIKENFIKFINKS